MQKGVVQSPETLYQFFLLTSSTQHAISRCWAAGACLGRYATTCLVDATYSAHPCPFPPPLPFPPALPLGPWPAFPSPCPPTLLRALSPPPPPAPCLFQQAHSIRYGAVSDGTLARLINARSLVDQDMGRFSVDSINPTLLAGTVPDRSHLQQEEAAASAVTA